MFNPVDGLASRLKALLFRMVAADLAMQEHEVNVRILEQAEQLEADGKPDLAHRLRALAHSDLNQLEGPRRGRPRKQEGGAE
jgi:hypothetical protein